MRNSSGTMGGVSPRASDPPPDELMRRLEELGAAAESINGQRRKAVMEALTAGGSVRTVATAARLSPTTVQMWKSAEQHKREKKVRDRVEPGLEPSPHDDKLLPGPFMGTVREARLGLAVLAALEDESTEVEPSE